MPSIALTDGIPVAWGMNGLSTNTATSTVVSDGTVGLIALVNLFATSAPTDPSNPICSGMSYAGVPFDKIGESDFSAGWNKCLAFALYLPPVGSADLVIDFTTSANATVVWVLAYQNLHPQVPWGDVRTNTGNATSMTVPYTIGDESDFFLGGLSVATTGSATISKSAPASGVNLSSSPRKEPVVSPLFQAAGQKFEAAILPGVGTMTWGLAPAANYAALSLVLYDVNRPIAPPGATPYYLTERNEAFIGGQA